MKKIKNIINKNLFEFTTIHIVCIVVSIISSVIIFLCLFNMIKYHAIVYSILYGLIHYIFMFLNYIFIDFENKINFEHEQNIMYDKLSESLYIKKVDNYNLMLSFKNKQKKSKNILH